MSVLDSVGGTYITSFVMREEWTLVDYFRHVVLLGPAQVRGCSISCINCHPSLSGYHLAEASLFISAAMSLSVLEISKDIVDGVQVTPKVDFSSGAIS